MLSVVVVRENGGRAGRTEESVSIMHRARGVIPRSRLVVYSRSRSSRDSCDIITENGTEYGYKTERNEDSIALGMVYLLEISVAAGSWRVAAPSPLQEWRRAPAGERERGSGDAQCGRKITIVLCRVPCSDDSRTKADTWRMISDCCDVLSVNIMAAASWEQESVLACRTEDLATLPPSES